MSGNALTAGKNAGTLVGPSVREKSMRAIADREFAKVSKKYAETFIADADRKLGLTVTAETPDEDMERIDEMLYEKKRQEIQSYLKNWLYGWLLVGVVLMLPAITDSHFTHTLLECMVVFGLYTVGAGLMCCGATFNAHENVFDWFKTRRELRELCGEKWLPCGAVRAIATAKSER